jgi:predicted MFS family arabinose efflux permease
MNVGYKGLFWVDGATCIVAILLFWIKVKEKKKSKFTDKENPGEVLTHSVFKDKPFWIFLTVCLITGILFFQLFTTIPLYHKEQFNLSEFQTGLLLTLNGVLVFFLEMPIVSYIERNNINKLKAITLGCLAMAISLYLLLINNWAGILIIMMVFMTFAEMLAFPFSNSFAISRAPKGHEGRYMAIFSMSFSLAHILSAESGMEIIDRLGYQSNWFFMGTLGITGVLLCLWAIKLVKKESVQPA